MSKSALNQIAPGRSGRRLRRRRVPLPLPAPASASGPTATSPTRAMVTRYNADLANNLGNLLAACCNMVAKHCDGIGPAPRADSPLVAAVAASTSTACRGREARATRRSALEATWRLIRASQRPPRGQRAVEAPSPAPSSTACSGDASRPCGSWPSWPPRPCRRPAPSCGAGSACPARRPISACPRPRSGAAIPAACRSTRASPCSPGSTPGS